MDRDLLNILKRWIVSKNRKPIILRGARQVGKSWLAREVGKDFDNFIEVNFDEEAQKVVQVPPSPIKKQVLFIGGYDEVQTVDENGNPNPSLFKCEICGEKSTYDDLRYSKPKSSIYKSKDKVSLSDKKQKSEKI